MKIKGKNFPKLKGTAYARRMDKVISKLANEGKLNGRLNMGLLESMTALIDDSIKRGENKRGAFLPSSLDRAEYGDICEVILVDNSWAMAFIGMEYINGKRSSNNFNIPEKFKDINSSNVHWKAGTEIEGVTVWVPVDEARKVWVDEFTEGKEDHIVVEKGRDKK
jgi:hypothetical protein